MKNGDRYHPPVNFFAQSTIINDSWIVDKQISVIDEIGVTLNDRLFIRKAR